MYVGVDVNKRQRDEEKDESRKVRLAEGVSRVKCVKEEKFDPAVRRGREEEPSDFHRPENVKHRPAAHSARPRSR